MIYLVITILSSSGMVLMFKYFELNNTDKLSALTVNYITAGLYTNYYTENTPVLHTQFWNNDWFIYCILLGLVFISIFYATAYTTQKAGISVSITASKMSLVITLLFLQLYYKEPLTMLKWCMTIVAVYAVYLTTLPSKENENKKPLILLPFLIFLGSGLVDSSLKLLQDKYFGKEGVNGPLTIIFLTAGIAGIVLLLIRPHSIHKNQYKKNIRGGFILGTLNFISTYGLMKALHIKILPDGSLFPVVNTAIVLTGTFAALWIFKEKPSRINLLGISLAVISILIFTLS